jgi:hypothetical protein
MFKKQLLYRMTRLCGENGIEVAVRPDEKGIIIIDTLGGPHRNPSMPRQWYPGKFRIHEPMLGKDRFITGT